MNKFSKKVEKQKQNKCKCLKWNEMQKYSTLFIQKQLSIFFVVVRNMKKKYKEIFKVFTKVSALCMTKKLPTKLYTLLKMV